MKFGKKLAVFLGFALLLDLIPLELALLSSHNDLATGQMLGLFVLIALLTCVVAGSATYRHFRDSRGARVFRRTVIVIFFTVFAFGYLFEVVHFVEQTNHSAAGWHWTKIFGLLERLVLAPCAIYFVLWSDRRLRRELPESP